MGESLSTSQKTTFRISPLLPSPHIPDVVSSARSEPQQQSVVSMIKEEFKNPIRPPRRKKSSVPTTPVEVNFLPRHIKRARCHKRFHGFAYLPLAYFFWGRANGTNKSEITIRRQNFSQSCFKLGSCLISLDDRIQKFF